MVAISDQCCSEGERVVYSQKIKLAKVAVAILKIDDDSREVDVSFRKEKQSPASSGVLKKAIANAEAIRSSAAPKTTVKFILR